MYFRLITSLIGMLICASFANAAPYAYITNLSDNTVSVIDVEKNAYIKKITLGTGLEPYGVAISSDGSRVYVSNQASKTISVIDALTDPNNPTLINTIGPLTNIPSGLAVNSAGTRLYVANYDGMSLSVIDLTLPTPSVIASPTVGMNPVGVAVSPDGATVYVTNSGDNNITPIRTSDNTSLTSFPAGNSPMGIALGKVGTVTNIYVANNTADSTTGLTVINAADPQTIARTVGLGADSAPFAVAVSPDGSTVYVTKSGAAANGGDSVAAINTTTFAVTSIGVGRVPLGVAVSPDGFRVLTVNTLDSSVSVINTSNNNVITLGNVPDTSYASFFQSPQTLGNFIGPQLYKINATVGVGANGTITPAGDIWKADGTSQTFTFTPSAQYRIDKIHVDGNIVTPTPTSGYTFYAISAPHTIDATFTKDYDYVSITKTGTASGTVTSTDAATTINCGATCNASFTDGTIVTLTAVPDAGKYFAGWIGDSNAPSVNVCNGVTATTCTFTMTGYTHVTANFSATPVSDKVWMNPPGSYYSTLQGALDASQATVEIRTTNETFIEAAPAYNLSTGAVVTLKGGYTSRPQPGAVQGTAPTVFQGTFTITNGTLIADNIAIQ